MDLRLLFRCRAIGVGVCRQRFSLASQAKKLVCLIHDVSGQGMVEYVLVIGLIAMAVIAFLPPVANAIIGLIGKISAAIKV
jgi:Flp pilus assembly pilin Flp